MTNIAYGKNTTASSYVKPYSPSRAVDGSMAPIRRWLCNQLPGYMMVDFGGTFWIDRWVVIHMQASGWMDSNYNTTDYKLQGSMDACNWTDLDIVSNNHSSSTDRTFNAVKCRYVRLVVTRGININPQLASIVELGVYEAAPTSPYLSGLTLSSGTLVPAFSSNVFTYSANVGYDTDTISVTPTAEDPQAEIKVNNYVIPSGQGSHSVELTPGQTTPIDIQVTPLVGDPVHYTVNVTRATNNYLSNVVFMPPGRVVLDKEFNPNITHYTGTSSFTPISVIPTAEDADASITVNGNSVASGSAISVALSDGVNNIDIIVKPEIGNVNKQYTFNITK